MHGFYVLRCVCFQWRCVRVEHFKGRALIDLTDGVSPNKKDEPVQRDVIDLTAGDDCDEELSEDDFEERIITYNQNGKYTITERYPFW